VKPVDEPLDRAELHHWLEELEREARLLEKRAAEYELQPYARLGNGRTQGSQVSVDRQVVRLLERRAAFLRAQLRRAGQFPFAEASR
jgi:hypothetical protein